MDFLRSPLAFLDATVQQYGGAVGLKLGGEHVVLLADPVLARQVLIDLPEVFVKVCTLVACMRTRLLASARMWHRPSMRTQEGTAFFPGNSLAGNGLLVSDGQVWRRQRQLSNPAFRRSAIASYAAVRRQP